ncbi:MAG: hypothetical protein RJQ08_11775 [Salinisphaeraceae bacterium]
MPYKKTVIQVEVLSDQDWCFEDLQSTAYDITEGDCSGCVQVVNEATLTDAETAKALESQGSDPSFLLGEDDEDSDADDAPAGPRVIAHFTPEAWINDHAVEVDCEGRREIDVTPEIEAMGLEAALALKDNDYCSDALRTAADAPKWVRDWSGPFRVEVEYQVQAYAKAKGHIEATDE